MDQADHIPVPALPTAPRPSGRHGSITPWALILLGLVLRLYHLDAPPIGIHSWRQADTASIARNYARNGYDFLHPQIDWAGEKPGYVESEFPLYPFSVACVYAVTGIHDWAARLVSALAGAATVWVLYDLVAFVSGRRLARWAALLFAVLPLCVYYGRTIQPESMMLLCSVAGINLMARWSASGRLGLLAGSWACVTLACLLKLPTLYLGLPIAWLAWQRMRWKMLTSPLLWAYAVLLLAAVAGWYVYAYRLGVANVASFAIVGSDKFGRWDLLLDPAFYNTIIFRRLAERHFTWAGFALLVVGLVLPRRDPREWLFDVWMIAVVIYFLISPFPNQVHEYYQLPFMLPGVVAAGRALEAAWTRSRLVAVAAVGAVLAMSGFRILEYSALEDPAKSAEFEAAQAVDRATGPGDFVIAVDGKLPWNPTLLYLADRKGWAMPPGSLDPATVNNLKAHGARCLFGAAPYLWTYENRGWLEETARAHRPLVSTDRIFVIDLGAGKR